MSEEIGQALAELQTPDRVRYDRWGEIGFGNGRPEASRDRGDISRGVECQAEIVDGCDLGAERCHQLSEREVRPPAGEGPPPPPPGSVTDDGGRGPVTPWVALSRRGELRLGPAP